ncbi:glycerol-3-phosphate 1-O-acyltransferase PlsY [Bacillus sp. CGMCC 1.16607]|uniref:glycerol-3-phosphate 1-O-acyltransferase PlsY n=1 Tax=Bacillus sp. CGMCC 1.16607 TaxID=3351842 RepID=UPI003638AB42
MTILAFFIAYLLGSIPFALLVGKMFFGADIRKFGSGNLGTTNSVRILGKKAGLLVLIGDVSKGAVAALLPLWLNLEIEPIYVGFAAVLGHCFPLLAGFKGGKAVATTFGVLFIANPILLIIGLITFISMIVITKYVPIGSISIAPALFLYSFLAGDTKLAILFFVFIPFMLYLHRSNLRNMKNGTEPKINDKNIKKEKITKTKK